MASKRSSRTSTNTALPKADDGTSGSESKVFLIKKSLIPASDLEILNLTHPRTGAGAKFLIHEKQVYEIMSFTERYRSWFIAQSVVSNGNVFMTTLIDPLFLALSFLSAECSDRAVPIDQLFIDSETTKDGRLLEVFTDDDDQLELVADVKRSGDIKALKYNPEKTLSWLVRKCEKLTPKLMEHRIHCGTAATSANFVKSEKFDTEEDSKDDVLRYAYFIVADYISEDLGQQLLKRLGIELKAEGPPVKSQKVNPSANPMKRSISHDDDEQLEDVKPAAKKVAAEVKVSSKSKAMAKAASGSKSISSFFKKA